MYEICQNEFRLGVADPDYHFSSRGECDLDVKYRCIIARAREEYQVGRYSLLLFQDNPFERQDAFLCDEKYDYINSVVFYFIFIFCGRIMCFYRFLLFLFEKQRKIHRDKEMK